jgi:hypothetical protein
MMFDHVLLPRFSAVLVPGGPPADEDWLWYRLGFFVDAALPSVAGQRGAAPFEWLVLFDDRCPDDFRAAVEDLAAGGTFTPLWTHAPYGSGLFARAVGERADAPFLITSRMDSDDALACDFMAAVQARFAHQERLFVNFTRGVQIDRSGAVYRRDDVSGPFLSLIERRGHGDPLTVYAAAAHTRARALAPVLEVKAPPMWAQVVHGSNLVNIVNGPRISPRVVNERFTLDLAYRSQVPPRRLLAEKLAHRARLVGLGLRHPGEPIKYAEGRLARLRGTHVTPQGDGRTLMDRLKALPVRRSGGATPPRAG